MPRKTSYVDGVTLADERMQYPLNALKKAIAAANQGTGTGTTGLGVGYPIPYFGPAATTYWVADNSTVSTVVRPDAGTHTVDDVESAANATSDDNEAGPAMVSWWLIPADCATLVVRGRYVKKNGTYGRSILIGTYSDITDEERALGFCERSFVGLRSKKVLDVTRAISISTSGAKAHNPVEPYKAARVAPQTAAGVTVASSMAAWPNPGGAGEPAIGYPPYGSAPHYPQYLNPVLPADQGEALARLDLRNWSPLNVRITSVGAAEKDRDGVYYPVTCTFTAGIVDRITFRGFRVGRKRPEDYTKYGKKYHRWRFDLSETDRDAGTAELRVGPFGPRQAKHGFHITRIHAVDFRDVTQSRRTVEWYPAVIGDCAGPDDIGIGFATSPSTDVDSAYQKAKANANTQTGRVPGAVADGTITADPDDVSAGQATNWQNAQTSDGSNSTDTGTPAGKRRILAVLAPGEAVDGKLANFVVTTSPDLATEKDSDAIIKFSADIQTPAGAASTAGDANATRGLFIFYRKGDADVRDSYIRKRVELNPTDDMAEFIFHRKIGRTYHMKKMRLMNGISKVDTDLKTQTGGGLTSGLFVAGATGGAYTDTDAHLGISSVTLADADSANLESNKAHIKASIVNQGWNGTSAGTFPVIPKRMLVYVSKRGTVSDPGSIPADNPTSGQWRLEKELALGDEPNLATIATVTRTFSVKLRRKQDHWIRVRLYVKGSATPIDSSSLLYSSDSEMPSKNAWSSRRNIFRNGAFLHDQTQIDATGAVTDLGRITKTPGGTQVTTGTSNVFWDKANHRVGITSGAIAAGEGICENLKKQMLPGEQFTMTFLVKSSGAISAGVEFDIRLSDSGESGATRMAYPAANGVPITFPALSSAAYIPVTIPVRVNPAYVQSGTQRVQIYPSIFSPTWSGTIYIDDVQFNRGNEGTMFHNHNDDPDNPSANISTDTGNGDVGRAAGGGNDGFNSSTGVGGRPDLD